MHYNLGAKGRQYCNRIEKCSSAGASLNRLRRIKQCAFHTFFIPGIGIGGLDHRRRPCHTTRHAGPHRAVREVEVMKVWAPPAGRSKRWSTRS